MNEISKSTFTIKYGVREWEVDEQRGNITAHGSTFIEGKVGREHDIVFFDWNSGDYCNDSALPNLAIHEYSNVDSAVIPQINKLLDSMGLPDYVELAYFPCPYIIHEKDSVEMQRINIRMVENPSVEWLLRFIGAKDVLTECNITNPDSSLLTKEATPSNKLPPLHNLDFSYDYFFTPWEEKGGKYRRTMTVIIRCDDNSHTVKATMTHQLPHVPTGEDIIGSNKVFGRKMLQSKSLFPKLLAGIESDKTLTVEGDYLLLHEPCADTKKVNLNYAPDLSIPWIMKFIGVNEAPKLRNLGASGSSKL